MCGFVGAFDLSSGGSPIAEGLKEELRAQVLEMSKRIRHRGRSATAISWSLLPARRNTN